MTSTDEIDQERVILDDFVPFTYTKNSICTYGGSNNIFVTHISLVSKANCAYDAICTSEMSTSTKINEKNEENKNFQSTG